MSRFYNYCTHSSKGFFRLPRVFLAEIEIAQSLALIFIFPIHLRGSTNTTRAVSQIVASIAFCAQEKFTAILSVPIYFLLLFGGPYWRCRYQINFLVCIVSRILLSTFICLRPICISFICFQ